MNLSFLSDEAERCRAKMCEAEAAYKEAIRKNTKFSELKKIYRAYKQSEKEFDSLIEKERNR